MKQWHEVHDSREEMPEEWDATSSAVVVYQRQNIRQETRPDMEGGEVTEWVYEQRELSHEEASAIQAEILRGSVAQNRADIDFIALMGGIDL